MSTSFGKDPQNPRDGGDGEGGKWPEVIKAEKQVVIGGGSSNIGGGTGCSSIKHLSDPHNPRHGGDHDINDGSTWFDGNGESIILKVGGEGLDHEWYIRAAGQDRIGSTEYGGRTSEDISDGTGWGIKDPTDTIDQEDWFGPATGPNPVPNEGEGGYIEGDYGFSGDWGLSGVWDKQDPTWLSGPGEGVTSGDTTGL